MCADLLFCIYSPVVVVVWASDLDVKKQCGPFSWNSERICSVWNFSLKFKHKAVILHTIYHSTFWIFGLRILVSRSSSLNGAKDAISWPLLFFVAIAFIFAHPDVKSATEESIHFLQEGRRGRLSQWEPEMQLMAPIKFPFQVRSSCENVVKAGIVMKSRSECPGIM